VGLGIQLSTGMSAGISGAKLRVTSRLCDYIIKLGAPTITIRNYPALCTCIIPIIGSSQNWPKIMSSLMILDSGKTVACFWAS